MKSLGFSLLSLIACVSLSADTFAQAPSTLGKSKAKEKNEKKPAAQASDFMPAAEDLSDDTPKKDPNEEIKDLQSKRWVDQGAIEKPRPVNAPSGKMTWTSTCTDKAGKVLKPEDAGYQTCVQEVSDANNNKVGGVGIETEPTKTTTSELDANGKPKANVGVQFKIGN